MCDQKKKAYQEEYYTEGGTVRTPTNYLPPELQVLIEKREYTFRKLMEIQSAIEAVKLTLNL